MFRTLLLLWGLLTAVASGPLGAAEPQPQKVRALILDGQNNHNWRATTPVIRAILEESGRFRVDVATMPTGPQNAAARQDFSPPLQEFDVVVSNYSDYGSEPAPKAFLDKLTQWVADGGGFVAVHAATAGIEHHAQYDRMIGLGWGGPNRGDRLAVDGSGNVVRTPKGQGRGTAHGPHGPIDVTVWSADHPVVKDLPRTWRVARDELWFSTRGPAEELTVLATGYSPNTKQNEPLLWTVGYGQGRVFVNLLGHDQNTMQDPGFRTTLLQGTEWAATGQVTLPVPQDFPE